MSIVYHKQPCPKCKAKCQIWLRNGKEFRWCHYCGWKEWSDCHHLIITRWETNDGEPVDIWSCTNCPRKFEPVVAPKEKYEAANPLGGPARMFDAIAERIRAGEDYYSVLADYGVTVEVK